MVEQVTAATWRRMGVWACDMVEGGPKGGRPSVAFEARTQSDCFRCGVSTRLLGHQLDEARDAQDAQDADGAGVVNVEVEGDDQRDGRDHIENDPRLQDKLECWGAPQPEDEDHDEADCDERLNVEQPRVIRLDVRVQHVSRARKHDQHNLGRVDGREDLMRVYPTPHHVKTVSQRVGADIGVRADLGERGTASIRPTRPLSTPLQALPDLGQDH